MSEKVDWIKNILMKNWIEFLTDRSENTIKTIKRAFPELKFYEDKKYNFREAFNSETGVWVTGDCKDGSTPFQRSFPALIDIGIMGNCPNGREGICAKAGIQCYQNAPCSTRPNMVLNDFKSIIDQSVGKVFQVALGRSRRP